MLEVGIKAPDFELPDQNGELHRLSDYRGHKVILYFYPKDNTSGCTKQACGFGERYPQIREKGAVVLGVSKDSVASQSSNNRVFKFLNLPIRIDLVRSRSFKWGGLIHGQEFICDPNGILGKGHH